MVLDVLRSMPNLGNIYVDVDILICRKKQHLHGSAEAEATVFSDSCSGHTGGEH